MTCSVSTKSSEYYRSYNISLSVKVVIQESFRIQFVEYSVVLRFASASEVFKVSYLSLHIPV